MAKAKKSPIIPIIIVIAVLMVLGIAGYLLMNKGGVSTMGMKKEGGAFSSIKDALSKSVSLECEFEENGTKTKSYIKNGAIRADMTSANAAESGSMIMKNKKMYFWNQEGGFMMEVPDYKAEDVTDDTSDDGKPNQGGDLLKAMEEYKDKCKASVVSDSLFTPPADVTFTDMSKMMPSGIPQTDANGQMNEEQVQKYMQQFKGDSDYSDQ